MKKGSRFHDSVAGSWHTLPSLEGAMIAITGLSTSRDKEQVLRGRFGSSVFLPLLPPLYANSIPRKLLTAEIPRFVFM